MICGYEALDLEKENLPSVWHAVGTAVAARFSVLLARLLGMPEAYWAVIATLVVRQSPLNSTVPLAIERIVASGWAHRFAEMSLGIFVALAVVAVSREEQQLFGDSTAE